MAAGQKTFPRQSAVAWLYSFANPCKQTTFQRLENRHAVEE